MDVAQIISHKKGSQTALKFRSQGAAHSWYRRLTALKTSALHWLVPVTAFCQNLHFKRPSPPLLTSRGCERLFSHVCITIRVCKISAKSARELAHVDVGMESKGFSPGWLGMFHHHQVIDRHVWTDDEWWVSEWVEAETHPWGRNCYFSRVTLSAWTDERWIIMLFSH